MMTEDVISFNEDINLVLLGQRDYAWAFGDSTGYMRGIPARPGMSIITDPPYPGIVRDYGTFGEDQWQEMMAFQMNEYKRLVGDTGSAMIILQPNQSHVGATRPWLYEFLSRWTTNWNMIQDAYWMNYVGLPSAGAARHGLLRGMLKFCAWFGSPTCYRDQKAILWKESGEGAIRRAAARCDPEGLKAHDNHESPSGHRRNRLKVHEASAKRGGVTPFNVWPIANNRSETGHGAETPIELARQWIRYITPPGGIVIDPFGGGANIGVAALREGRRYIGIEKYEPAYYLGKNHLSKEIAAKCAHKDVEA